MPFLCASRLACALREQHTRVPQCRHLEVEWQIAKPISDGETGRVVQEIFYAAYASAALGRRITLSFRPKGIVTPIDLWKKPELAQAAL